MAARLGNPWRIFIEGGATGISREEAEEDRAVAEIWRCVRA